MLGSRAGSQGLIELGERIRQRRQEKNISQETFAEKAGVSVNTVSRIEGGQTATSIEIFTKMVEVLDADANELLGRKRNVPHGKNPEETMVLRIREMRPKEQKIVIQTMTALIEGIEAGQERK